MGFQNIKKIQLNISSTRSFEVGAWRFNLLRENSWLEKADLSGLAKERKRWEKNRNIVSEESREERRREEIREEGREEEIREEGRKESWEERWCRKIKWRRRRIVIKFKVLNLLGLKFRYQRVQWVRFPRNLSKIIKGLNILFRTSFSMLSSKRGSTVLNLQ